MKRLFIIPILLFWCAFSFAAQPVREGRFSQADTYYQWEWRFNTGFADICFGNETCPANWGVYTSYLDVMRYQCVTGGAAIKIRILTPAGGTNTGTIRMGIYADRNIPNNWPDALLWEGTAQSYVVDTWIEEAVSGITLVAGAWYWLGFKVSESTAELCYVPSGPLSSHLWRTNQTYTDPFPNPFGSTSFGNRNQYSMQICVAGGVADVYSGKFPRGIGRGITR